MTQQLDMIPTPIAEDADVMRRIDAMLPKARAVTPRLPLQACMHPVDALKAMAAREGLEVDSEQEACMRAICDEEVPLDGHEIVLPERAREDHR